MSYLFYRRIKGPIFLLTFGVSALLAQWHILGFAKSWPLYLIVYGVLRLLEGAVLAASVQAQAPANPAAFSNTSFNTPAYGTPDYGTPGYSSADYVAPAYPPGSLPASATGLTAIAPAPIQTTEEKS